MVSALFLIFIEQKCAPYEELRQERDLQDPRQRRLRRKYQALTVWSIGLVERLFEYDSGMTGIYSDGPVID